MKILITAALLSWSALSYSQVIRFQSVGSSGTTPGIAENGTIKHMGVVGSTISYGSGHLVGSIDHVPAHAASSITVLSYTSSTITLQWVKGNGSARMVLARKADAVNAIPDNGTGYTPSAAFGDGSQIGSGNYVVYDGTGNTVSVTGLEPDTHYHFRIFEYNGRYGANSNNAVYQTATVDEDRIQQSTYAEEPPAQPSHLVFDEITATSMTGSFTPVDAEGYLVLRRESADPVEIPVHGVTYDGPHLGNSTIVYNGSSTEFASTGLVAGTVYHYKVFAYNGREQSIRYRTTDPLAAQKITVPDIPPRPGHTDEGVGSFRLVWTTMQGAEGYEIEVARNEGLTNLVQGYDPKSIIGGDQSQHLLENLNTSSYYYRIQAVNSSGKSGYSPYWSVFIVGVPGSDDLNVTFSNNTKPVSTSDLLSVSVTGGAGDKEVTVYWRPIRGKEYFHQLLERAGTSNSYQTTVDVSVTDELGVEYYVQVSDNSATISTSPGGKQNDYIYRPIPSHTVIPDLPSGGNISDYRIISIPYALSLNNTAIVFSALGGYDKSRWRLLQWNGTAYMDNPSAISPGDAYWFNARGAAVIELGEGTVSRNNQSSPFPLSLRQGWNLVSTPYPFAVSWDDIIDHNGASGISEYYVFNGAGYEAATMLEPWKGGFVFSEGSVTLDVPVLLEASGGRKKEAEYFNGVPGDGNWWVPLAARQGKNEHRLAGFGMHALAHESKDKFDIVSLPRFIEYVDLQTEHSDYAFPHFTRDIVPLSDEYHWEFIANGSGRDSIEVTWNANDVRMGSGQLLLYDRSAGRMVDMRAHGRHMTLPGSPLRIIYSRDSQYPSGGMQEARNAFPNPFTSNVNLPSFINLDQGSVWVHVRISNLTGMNVYTYSGWSDHEHLIEPKWEGNGQNGDPVAPGLYYYEVTYRYGKERMMYQGKLVKR